MINARDLMRYTKLSQVIRDRDREIEEKRGVYNTKQPEKSFIGNVKAIRENSIQWYRKRFPKMDCCNPKRAIFESGFAFCRKCGFLHV